MAILSGLYFLVAVSFFGTLFDGFRKSTDLSTEQKECSLKAMSLAAIFWPVVVPSAYLEKRSKAQQEYYQLAKVQKNQVPVLPKFDMSQVLLSSEFEINGETKKQQEAVESLVA